MTETALILGLIVLLSFDTTLFLQSMTSQPVISCQIIGLFVGNYELGLMVGLISQLLFLSYIPVGGAKIPDPQFAPNIMVFLLRNEPFSIELVGQWLPVIILGSVLFMAIISLERWISTWYMKYIPYTFLNIKLLISGSFFLHFILFGYAVYYVYTVLFTYKPNIEKYFLYSGEHVFYYIAFFALGNLCLRYNRRRSHG